MLFVLMALAILYTDHKIVYSWQYHKLDIELLDRIVLDNCFIVFNVQ